MKTALQILKKDLRLLRLPLLAWWALLAAEMAYVLSGVSRGDEAREAWKALEVAVGFWSVAHVLLGLVLVALAVQTDGPQSPTAFCRTRPVGSYPVLVGKLAFAVGPVLTPWLLANVAVLFINGADLASATLSALELAELSLAWAVPVMAVAALTATLATTVVSCIALLAYCTLSALFIEVLTLHIGVSPREQVMLRLMLLLGSLVLLTAYRSTVRTALLLIGLGAPFATLVSFTAPLGWMNSEPRETPASELPSSLHLDVRLLERETLLARPADSWADPSTPPAKAVIDLRGVPEGKRVEVLKILSGKQVLQSEVEHPDPTPATVHLGTLQPAMLLAPVSTAWLPAAGLAPGSRKQVAIDFALVEDEVDVSVPRRVGESARGRSCRLRIAAILPEAVTADLWTTDESDRFRVTLPSAQYWFHNSLRGEILPSVKGGFWSTPLPPVGRGVELRRYVFTPRWPGKGRLADAGARRAWLEGAELVRTRPIVRARGVRLVPLP